jgi:hypothetical protein
LPQACPQRRRLRGGRGCPSRRHPQTKDGVNSTRTKRRQRVGTDKRQEDRTDKEPDRTDKRRDRTDEDQVRTDKQQDRTNTRQEARTDKEQVRTDKRQEDPVFAVCFAA